MKLDRLVGTCSMFELNNVKGEDIRTYFKESLVYHTIGTCKNKAIIYNTNYSWSKNFDLRFQLYKAGFRKVTTYKGHGGSKVHVLVKKYK